MSRQERTPPSPKPRSRRTNPSPTRAGAPARGPAAPRDTYHHGALREALITAADELLAERGVEGFSLREVARRSGVSPAAPAHHFGDAAGLLHAVTVQAFDGLTTALLAGDARGGDDPVACLREQGLGYVGFAFKHPGRFDLMFSSGVVRRDEALINSAQAAYGVLQQGIRRLRGLAPGAPLAPADELALVATWSVVHGFAHLALAGQFDPRGQPPSPTIPAARRTLLTQVLAPMLEEQLRGLRVSAGRAGGRKAAG